MNVACFVQESSFCFILIIGWKNPSVPKNSEFFNIQSQKIVWLKKILETIVKRIKFYYYFNLLRKLRFFSERGIVIIFVRSSAERELFLACAVRVRRPQYLYYISSSWVLLKNEEKREMSARAIDSYYISPKIQEPLHSYGSRSSCKMSPRIVTIIKSDVKVLQLRYTLIVVHQSPKCNDSHPLCFIYDALHKTKLVSVLVHRRRLECQVILESFDVCGVGSNFFISLYFRGWTGIGYYI